MVVRLSSVTEGQGVQSVGDAIAVATGLITAVVAAAFLWGFLPTLIGRLWNNIGKGVVKSVFVDLWRSDALTQRDAAVLWVNVRLARFVIACAIVGVLWAVQAWNGGPRWWTQSRTLLTIVVVAGIWFGVPMLIRRRLDRSRRRGGWGLAP